MDPYLILTILAAVCTAVAAETPPAALTVGAIFDQNDTATSAAFEAALKAVSLPDGQRLEPRIAHIRTSAEAERAACDLLAEGAVTLVTDAAPEATRAAARVADKAGVPHLSAAPALPSLESLSLQLLPRPEAIYRAVRREMGSRGNDRVAFVTQRSGSVATFQKVRSIFGEQTLIISAKTPLAFSLANAKANGLRTFVVEVPGTTVAAFLNEVRASNMAGLQYAYFFVALDSVGLQTSQLDSQMHAKVQFFSLVPFLKTEKASQELKKVLNTDQVPVKATLIYDAIQLLAESFNQVMQSKKVSPQRLSCSGPEMFSHGMVIINTMRSRLSKMRGMTAGDSETADLKLRVLDISKGDQTSRTRPLRQAKPSMRVVTVVENLFVKKSTKNGATTYDGFAVALLKLLAEDVGFTYTLYESPDGFYGAKNSSGIWNGMIGELANKKADMAIGPITITYEREQVAEFTTPFMQVTTNMLTLRPSVPSASAFAFLMPISPEIWITLLVLYVIISFVLFFVARLSPYEWHKPHDKATYRVNKFGLHSAFWFTIAGCLRQYPGIAPRSTSARVIAGFWWVVVLLVFLCYAVNLQPFLSRQRAVKPISTFTDLAQKSGFIPGTLSNGSTEAFFKRSNLETYVTIYEKMKSYEGNFKKSYKEGITSVLNGNGFIFIGEKPLLTKAAQQFCELQVLPAGIDPKGYGFGLQKNSEYRKRINSALLKMQKLQKLAELERKYLRNKGQCGDPSEDREESALSSTLTMSNMFGIFLLIIPGILIGLLCLVGESFTKRCCGSESESIPMSEFRRSLTITTKRTIVESEAAAAAPAPSDAAASLDDN